MGIDVPKSDKELEKDPFLMLGYGVNAYLDIMRQFALMFFFISLFCIPVFFVNGMNQTQGLKLLNPDYKFQMTRFSIGNLGGADVICNQKPLRDKHIDLACTNGQKVFLDVDNAEYGVMSSFIENKIHCSNDSPQLLEELKRDGVEKCTDRLDVAKLQKRLSDTCRGKDSCELNLEDIYTTPTSDNDQCGPSADFFIQVPCVLDPSVTQYRRLFGLVLACSGIFIYLFTVLFVDYVQAVQKNKFVEFDVKTITAGDYTIEFDIGPEVYEEFKKNYYDVTNPISEVAQFKLYV